MPATRPRLRASTGCDQCRQRKKKCDETHPACAACVRWQLSCTWRGGAPPKASCQTSTGIQVVLPLVGQQRRLAPLPASAAGDLPQLEASVAVATSRRFQPPTIEVALHQFLRGYSSLTKHTSCVDPLYRSVEPLHDKLQQDPSSSSLHQALEAISLAYMGTQNGDQKVLDRAQAKYSMTIGTLRHIFGHSSPFAANKVLAAIRLCTGYELLTCNDPKTAGWAFHMKGQATLARILLPNLRNGAQMDRHLFYEALLSIAVVHGYARAPMPFTAKELEDNVVGRQDLEGDLAVLAIRVNAIRRTAEQFAIKEFGFGHLQDAEDTIQKAEMLCKDLQRWEIRMETINPYKTIQLSDEHLLPGSISADAENWSTEVHQYRSLHDANMYNQARCWLIYTSSAMIQIRLWCYVQESYGRARPETEPGFEIIQYAVDNICAAVPFYLGLFEQTQHLDANLKGQVASWGGGYASLWFWLATAAGVESICAEQRKWIVGRLAFIGNQLGHQWAKFISKNPPSDVILGSKISTGAKSMYKAIPGWPDDTPDPTSVS